MGGEDRTGSTVERLNTALAGRYRLEEALGAGGMATVYRAHDLRHGRDVAFKVLHPELAAALGAERFLREIAIAARLSHPNILPVHDSGEADGFLYYVMPLVEGDTLRSLLDRERQLPLDRALRIAEEVGDALAHAHGQGIVHRDVKPENVLLQGGRAVVADFGVAKAVEDAGGERLTKTGMAVGTPVYMSPEQAAADPVVDQRSDIYSLGCVLYEMLAGDPPFSASTPMAILARKADGTVPSVRLVRDSVSEELEAVLDRALARTPADRFATVEEFVRALKDPGAHTSPTRATRVRGRRRRPLPLVAVGAVGALALVAVWRATTTDRAAPAGLERVLVVSFANETGDPELDDLGKIVADWLARDLQQIEAIDVIDPRAAVFSAAGVQGAIEGGGERLAALLGAGTVVSGSYHLLGDSLYLQARLTDARTGTLIESLAPISGSRADPLPGMERLGGQVTGAAAARFDPDFAPIAAGTNHPQSYAAYREYVAAMEHIGRGDFAAAGRLLYRTLALDSTFYMAGLAAAILSQNMAQRDSLLQTLDARRDRLTELERHLLDALLHDVRGERLAAFRAGRAAYELAPSLPEIAAIAAPRALSANHPRAAADMLQNLDLSQGLIETYVGNWRDLNYALHMLGEYERELEVARDGRTRFPDRHLMYLHEARALAALGRREEMERAIDGLRALPPVNGLSAGDALRQLAVELKAHGDDPGARELYQRALSWYEELPAEDAALRVFRGQHAHTLRFAERWAEAREALEALVEEDRNDIESLGFLGEVAAALGDTALALRIEQEFAALDEPYMRGHDKLHRAQIQAMLGDRDQAVSLLRQAFAEGLGYGIWVHREPSFQSLRGYPPFDELVRPKG